MLGHGGDSKVAPRVSNGPTSAMLRASIAPAARAPALDAAPRAPRPGAAPQAREADDLDAGHQQHRQDHLEV